MATLLNDENALYLYGVVAHPVELPCCDAIEDGTSIDLIAGAGIACVVSSVRARDYCATSIGPNAAAQLEWATPRVWRHHEVVRRLHETTTVIPLKFGTLCSSVAAVRDMLARFAAPIEALLDRFHGKDEWRMTIRVDVDRVTARLEAGDPELRALRADETTLPEGRAFFARKKRQQRNARLLTAQVTTTTAAVYERLAGQVDACCAETPDSSVAAVLVARARFSNLAACLAELEAEHAADGLSLELRGPWAPYSFVNGRVDCRELTPTSGIESRPLIH